MKHWTAAFLLCMAAFGLHAVEPVDTVRDLGAYLERAEEQYFSPTSPDYDETRMAEILRAALATGRLDEGQTSVAEWMLHEVCERNAPDSLAADFTFELVGGTRCRLHNYLPGQPLALMFYDPTCRHCEKVMRELPGLASRINVLAVCIDTSFDTWVRTRDGLPEGYVPAFDRSDVSENDIYMLRSLPGLYLLDPSRRVVLKNPSPGRLLNALDGAKAKGGRP